MRGGSKKEIEVSGADVEEAIARGLASLGISREKAHIEILDEGSRGLLGLGRRDAVVRLRVIGADATTAPESRRQEPRREEPRREERKPTTPPVAEPTEPRPTAPKAQPREARRRDRRARDDARSGDRERAERGAERPPAPRKETPAPAARKARPVEPDDDDDDTWPEAAVADPEALTSESAAAKETWETLLGKLQIDADVALSLSEPDERTGRQIPIVDVTGKDLSILIGPRGDTLNAMQFVTRIMVAHRLKRRAYFVVDVEGFRERRAQALERLAERMAQKALKRGRPITLEPMPPNERRVIHMALRETEGVYTQSTGEGAQRRVRILLK